VELDVADPGVAILDRSGRSSERPGKEKREADGNPAKHGGSPRLNAWIDARPEARADTRLWPGD
jgi:hypothetical protein